MPHHQQRHTTVSRALGLTSSHAAATDGPLVTPRVAIENSSAFLTPKDDEDAMILRQKTRANSVYYYRKSTRRDGIYYVGYKGREYEVRADENYFVLQVPFRSPPELLEHLRKQHGDPQIPRSLGAVIKEQEEEEKRAKKLAEEEAAKKTSSARSQYGTVPPISANPSATYDRVPQVPKQQQPIVYGRLGPDTEGQKQ